MSKDELLDLVNEKDEVTGRVWKSVAHKDPSKIHREVAIIVFDTKGRTLIQKRSVRKAKHPGVWVNTVAGHVGKSESPEKAIERELLEELGFSVEPQFYKKIFDRFKNEESRFFWIYYAIIKKIPEVKIDKEEVEEVLWIKPPKLAEFAKDHKWDVNGLSHKYIMEMYSEFFKYS